MCKATVSSLVLTGFISLLFASTGIAHEKVVVVPLSISKTVNSMQGQGRSGADLMTHAVLNGYCTSLSGVSFALSNTIADWAAAASVCPSNTWVCSANDLPTSGACDVPTAEYSQNASCSGARSPWGESTFLYGWVSDSSGEFSGGLKASSDFSSNVSTTRCFHYRAWCCWK